MRYNDTVTTRRARALVAAICIASGALSACGSSGAGVQKTPNTGTSTVGTTAAVPSGSGAPADPATTAAVRKAYVTFFDPKSGIAASQRYLQHGDLFAAALAAQASRGAQEKLGVR